MTIYLDIVLLENLCMNYIILFATAYILKIKRHHYRMILSALIGGIYAILAYMQIFEVYSNMFVKIILSVCMIYIAFWPKGIKGLLKQLLIFYLVSFVFGGCAFALLYFVKPQDILQVNGVYIGTYPVKIALLGGLVGFIVVHTAFKVVKNKMRKKALIYDIEINIEGKKMRTKAMLDTGNQLKDPITGVPVVVVTKEALREIIPDNILDNIEKVMGGEWKEEEENINYRSRFRIIPFTSIGKQNGMLLGLKVDKVKLITDIDEITNENVIVCIYNQKLTKANTYSALIGIDMLEGREEHELITVIKR